MLSDNKAFIDINAVFDCKVIIFDCMEVFIEGKYDERLDNGL